MIGFCSGDGIFSAEEGPTL